MTNTITILLACLSMIESGDDDRKIGDNGKSRGRYQISEAAWRCEVAIPWRKWSRSPDWSACVATRIINRRINAFKTIWHREPDAIEIYVIWNAPAQAMKGKISKRVLERAKRFENLVEAKTRDTKK